MPYDIDYSIWPSNPVTGEFSAGPLRKGFDDCPRAGGGYVITVQAAGLLNSGLVICAKEKDKLRARLTTILIDQRMLGVPYPLVTPKLIDKAISKRPLRVHERADRLLRFIADQSGTVGDSVSISNSTHAAYAWSESIDWLEIEYFLNYLVKTGALEGTMFAGAFQGNVTIDGYSRIADRLTNVDSSQAFVAMWFDESMDEAARNGIELGIEDAGYRPYRIDREDYIDKIEDEVIAQIRRSRFLVADFTHGADGARGSVYYEAGFAQGLGLPVIFTCRKDALKTLHFDTAHFNHIDWGDPAELRERLKTRILRVIGEGPGLHAIQ